MEKYLLAFLVIMFMIACTESSIQTSEGKVDPEIEKRSNLNELVLGDGISRTGYSNPLTGEYEYAISLDFEVRPYGDPNWYQFTGAKKIKVRCNCYQGCSHGSCNSIVSESSSVVAECDNQCGTPYYNCSCKMKVRLTTDYNDLSIVEYEEGAEVRLQ